LDGCRIRGQAKAHEATITLSKKEIASGEDTDAKAFATATLPTLQHHPKAIREIADESGASAK
jgi:putative membrane protein